MSNLLEMPLVLAALAFTGGYVLAKLGALLGRREKTPVKSDTERDRQFRAMEADLRVARKQLEQGETDMAAIKKERGELQAELDERSSELLEVSEQVVDLKEQLKGECEKTQGLRNELSQRAEQGIRAQVQLRDMETELSLAQAGSDAINDEINQLVSDREELTNRLAELQRLQEQQKEAESGASIPQQVEHPLRRHDDVVSESHPLRRKTDLAVNDVDS